MMITVLYVDGGMWRDPTLYGPFDNEDQAVQFIVHTLRLANIDGDWTDFMGENEALILTAINPTPCGCESSLCDHAKACPRPADPRFRMAYVQHTCTQCASNMCATGGDEYITLTEEHANA